jgi:hypothetical protein
MYGEALSRPCWLWPVGRLDSELSRGATLKLLSCSQAVLMHASCHRGMCCSSCMAGAGRQQAARQRRSGHSSRQPGSCYKTAPTAGTPSECNHAGCAYHSVRGPQAAASAGKVPAASLAGQCTSFASVSPWDIGNHFPDVVLCCGGSIGFQWSVRLSIFVCLSEICCSASSRDQKC